MRILSVFVILLVLWQRGMSNRKEKSILLLIIMKNELLKQQFRLKKRWNCFNILLQVFLKFMTRK